APSSMFFFFLATIPTWPVTEAEGGPTAPSLWIQQFSGIVEGIQPVQQVMTVETKTTGVMKLWVRRWRTLHPQPVWTAFQAAFVQEASRKRTRGVTLQELQTMKQGDTEPTEEYLARARMTLEMLLAIQRTDKLATEVTSSNGPSADLKYSLDASQEDSVSLALCSGLRSNHPSKKNNDHSLTVDGAFAAIEKYSAVNRREGVAHPGDEIIQARRKAQFKPAKVWDVLIGTQRFRA
ncbi:hypothetical protein BGZ58_005610, partial [Dissophora ornata]